jgi:hypothetical protein
MWMTDNKRQSATKLRRAVSREKADAVVAEKEKAGKTQPCFLPACTD